MHRRKDVVVKELKQSQIRPAVPVRSAAPGEKCDTCGMPWPLHLPFCKGTHQ